MTRIWLLVAGLFAATLLAYSPAIRADFIWNDSDYVTAPALRTTAGLARIWFELGATEQYYPILHSTFWLEHKLWGDSPTGYHLINILLHAGCACLLAAILRRVFGMEAGAVPGSSGGRGVNPGRLGEPAPTYPRVAVLAAFLFALHPVYVESVAWISEQKNTLSLLFYLLAALAYLRFAEARSPRTYLIATLVFVIALLSKSTTAMLPPALLVVFWWRRGRLEWQRDVRPLLPWFALGAAMGLLSAHVERKYIGAEGAEFALNGLERNLLAGRIAWFYCAKLFWPADLIFIYPRWEVRVGAMEQWLYPLAAVALLAGLWVLRGRTRGPLAAALFFGGSLFPVLGFFNVYAFLFSYVADHWQYLPSIGLVVLAAAGLAKIFPPGSNAGRVMPVAVIVALGLLTLHQSRMYADMRTFYRATVARNPAAWMAHNNLGNLLREDGQLEAAVTHYEAALRARGDLAKAHNNLGSCLRDLKRPREALEHYEQAVRLQPNYIDARNNIGRLLREVGRKDEALSHLLAAVQLEPDNADARNNLGMVLRDLGRMPEAVREFERAIRLNPQSSPAHLNLALTYSVIGRSDDAVRHYEEARRLNPKIPPLPTK